MNNDMTIPYGTNAYNSTSIPNQPSKPRNHIGPLSQHLPWGNPQSIFPIGFVAFTSPKKLRDDEEREDNDPGYRERLSQRLNAAFDHQRYRYTPLQGWTQFWIYMHGLGKGFFIVFTCMLFFGFWILMLIDERTFSQRLTDIFALWKWVGGVPALAWLIAHLVLKYVPERFLLKPSRKGPVWEMNRQTGMVTIFARKKGQFSKIGIEGDFVAPFYEFDATIHTIPDRQGFPLHMLNMVHRYRVAAIDFSVLMGKVSRQQACMALWDFWQRYMDISQPLPDLPELEVFRHLDPTTAEHDQRTGRPSRYWRDMDPKTFKAKIDEITDVTQVNMERPNLMAHYIQSA
ncbi:MAG: hypothetical protein V7751_17495 [Pseudoalteromonas distincta]